MEKIKVTIEETVSKTFEIEIPNEEICISEYVRDLYKHEKIVLEPGEIQNVQYTIEYENGEQTNWINM